MVTFFIDAGFSPRYVGCFDAAATADARHAAAGLPRHAAAVAMPCHVGSTSLATSRIAPDAAVDARFTRYFFLSTSRRHAI